MSRLEELSEKVEETKRIIIYKTGLGYWYKDKSNGFESPYLFNSPEDIKDFLNKTLKKSDFMKGWDKK